MENTRDLSQSLGIDHLTPSSFSFHRWMGVPHGDPQAHELTQCHFTRLFSYRQREMPSSVQVGSQLLLLLPLTSAALLSLRCLQAFQPLLLQPRACHWLQGWFMSLSASY